MLKIVHQHKHPVITIITPLKHNDKISKETKISVKRNDTPFIWASYESNNNTAKNFDLGLYELIRQNLHTEYTIKIDNDTLWGRHTLDKLYNTLKMSNDNVAYTYCSFEYIGSVNQKFPAILFDGDRLKMNNYISSNSMFKTDILKKIPLVTDEKYRRLLDWAYYLKLLNNDYVGKPVFNCYFIAFSNSDSVSAGGYDDFKLKYLRVKKDFIDSPS